MNVFAGARVVLDVHGHDVAVTILRRAQQHVPRRRGCRGCRHSWRVTTAVFVTPQTRVRRRADPWGNGLTEADAVDHVATEPTHRADADLRHGNKDRVAHRGTPVVHDAIHREVNVPRVRSNVPADGHETRRFVVRHRVNRKRQILCSDARLEPAFPARLSLRLARTVRRVREPPFRIVTPIRRDVDVIRV